MDISDESLATAAARGDRAAFASLLERHYDRIHGLCWRLTTWLYRVAVNAAHDRRRRAASHARAALGWGDWERGRQADIAAEAEAQDWLTAAMARLSDELRDTVALTLGEGLSQAEAGEVLGVSEGTVAWRMSEVKKKLRALAQEEAG